MIEYSLRVCEVAGSNPKNWSKSENNKFFLNTGTIGISLFYLRLEHSYHGLVGYHKTEFH